MGDSQDSSQVQQPDLPLGSQPALQGVLPGSATGVLPGPATSPAADAAPCAQPANAPTTMADITARIAGKLGSFKADPRTVTEAGQESQAVEDAMATPDKEAPAPVPADVAQTPAPLASKPPAALTTPPPEVKTAKMTAKKSPPAVVKVKSAKAKAPAATKPAAKKSAPMKRPAAALDVWDGAWPPKIRKIGANPFKYRISKIYVSEVKRCYRVILKDPSYATERQIGWEGSDVPTMSAWNKVVDACDKVAMEA